MENDDNKRDSRWGEMAVLGAFMGGVPGLLFNPTGDLIFSVVFGIIAGIIFWVGMGVIWDAT